MYVIKRDKTRERVSFDKINDRIDKLCFNLNRDFVRSEYVTKKVIDSLSDDIKTSAIDEISARVSLEIAGLQHHSKLAYGG